MEIQSSGRAHIVFIQLIWKSRLHRCRKEQGKALNCTRCRAKRYRDECHLQNVDEEMLLVGVLLALLFNCISHHPPPLPLLVQADETSHCFVRTSGLNEIRKRSPCFVLDAFCRELQCIVAVQIWRPPLSIGWFYNIMRKDICPTFYNRRRIKLNILFLPPRHCQGKEIICMLRNRRRYQKKKNPTRIQGRLP